MQHSAKLFWLFKNLSYIIENIEHQKSTVFFFAHDFTIICFALFRFEGNKNITKLCFKLNRTFIKSKN